MTVEDMKDLMLCLIEEGKGECEITYRGSDISCDDMCLLEPASNYLNEPDTKKYGGKWGRCNNEQMD